MTSAMKTVLKKVLPILQSIAESTAVLSAEHNVSLSIVYPCISTLKSTLTSMSSQGISSFVGELNEQLIDRFDLTRDIYLVSTYLDPRFKAALYSEYEKTKIIKFLKEFIERTHDYQENVMFEIFKHIFQFLL